MVKALEKSSRAWWKAEEKVQQREMRRQDGLCADRASELKLSRVQNCCRLKEETTQSLPVGAKAHCCWQALKNLVRREREESECDIP